MTNEDTSQSGFCKNSLHKPQDITHLVNESRSKIRLQDAKLYQEASGRELLVLNFYPIFRDLAWVWAEGQLHGVSLKLLDRSKLKAIKHPFLLYLKAHFVGHSLQELKLEAEGLRFYFTGERSFHWNFSKKEWVFEILDKKPYLQRLPDWAAFSKVVRIENKDGEHKQVSINNTVLVKTISKAEEKFSKLKQNVESDLDQATKWLLENLPHIEFFFQNPKLWGTDIETLPHEQQDWIRSVSEQVPYATPRKVALESLKKLQSRFERKKAKAQERLTKLLKEAPDFENQQVEKVIFKKDFKKESGEKKASKKVELAPGVEALVGRKAVENDELFRKAQSRDLWFHVRGQRGAHVWVKRGQKAFGAKGELSEDLIKKAAALAAKYSKASGAWISVDYTERRFLKKLKGSEAGALQVLQSKTIFVSLANEV